MALPNFEKNYNGEPTILWSNPEPSANFAGQDITLSSNDYDFLEFYFVDGSHSYCFKVPKGYGFKATVLIGEGANTHLGFRYRIITYTDDTHYAVGNGYIKVVSKTNPETDTYDHIVRPLYVIGYKNKE